MNGPEELDPRGHELELDVPADAIDDYGHVNNAVYLQWVEACCRAHAERVGMTTEAMRALGALPVVRRHTATYREPAFAGERLVVSTRIVGIGGVRAERRNEVRRRSDGALLVEVDTEWVWVDPERGRPRPMPVAIARAFGVADGAEGP